MHDEHEELPRSAAHTRALLKVFAVQAPPDFSAWVRARARNLDRPRCSKKPQRWVGCPLTSWKRAMVRGRLDGRARRRFWMPLGVAGMCCVLVVSLSFSYWLSASQKVHVAVPSGASASRLVSPPPHVTSIRRDRAGPLAWEAGEVSGTELAYDSGKRLQQSGTLAPPLGPVGTDSASFWATLVPVTPPPSTRAPLDASASETLARAPTGATPSIAYKRSKKDARCSSKRKCRRPMKPSSRPQRMSARTTLSSGSLTTTFFDVNSANTSENQQVQPLLMTIPCRLSWPSGNDSVMPHKTPGTA